MNRCIFTFCSVLLLASLNNSAGHGVDFLVNKVQKFFECFVCIVDPHQRKAYHDCHDIIPEILRGVTNGCIRKHYGKHIDIGDFPPEICENPIKLGELLACIGETKRNLEIELVIEDRRALGKYGACTLSLFSDFCME